MAVAGLALRVLACLMLSGVSATWTQANTYDPLVILCVAGVFSLTSAIASFWPAWKASTMDPIAALRQG